MPIDFTHAIVERTRDYTPRPWLMQRIAEWLGASERRRFFAITGEPGSGKSATAAWLCTPAAHAPGTATQHVSPVAAHHFCSARRPEWREPLSFIESVSSQLAQRYPAFGAALGAQSQITIHAHQHIQENRGNATNVVIHADAPESAFKLSVLAPLERLYAGGFKEEVLLLVDALDEGDLFSGSVKIGDLVAMCMTLPRPVRVIVTSRPGRSLQLLRDRGSLTEVRLDAAESADEVRRDIERYVRVRLDALPEVVGRFASGLTRPLFIEKFSTRADGNFQWSISALAMLAGAGRIDLAALEALPQGLPDLYSEFLRRIVRGNMERWRSEHSRVLGALAVAREELDVPQLARYTGLPQPIVHQVVAEMRQFLEIAPREAGDAYRIYHLSFVEYLLDQNAAKELACDPRDQHLRIVEAWARDTALHRWHDSDEYALRHIAVHLRALRDDPRWTEALFSLVSCEWMVAKRERLGTDLSFARDVTFAAATAESMSPRRTVEWLRAVCVLATLRSRVAAVPAKALALMARLGDVDRALTYVDFVAETERPAVRLQVAEVLAAGDPRRAEEILRPLLADTGTHGKAAAAMLARVLAGRGDLNGAMAMLRTLAPIGGFDDAVREVVRTLCNAGKYDTAGEVCTLVEDEHGRTSLLLDVVDAIAGTDPGGALPWAEARLAYPGPAVQRIAMRIGERNLPQAFELALARGGHSQFAILQDLLRVHGPAAGAEAIRAVGATDDPRLSLPVQLTITELAEHGDTAGARVLLALVPRSGAEAEILRHEARLRIAAEGPSAADAIVAAAGDADAARRLVAVQLAAAGEAASAVTHLRAITDMHVRTLAAGDAAEAAIARTRSIASALELLAAFPDDDSVRRDLAIDISRRASRLGELTAAVDAWAATKPWQHFAAGDLVEALAAAERWDDAAAVASEESVSPDMLVPVAEALVRRGEWPRAVALAELRTWEHGRLAACILAAAAEHDASAVAPLVRLPFVDVSHVVRAVQMIARRGQPHRAWPLLDASAARFGSEVVLARCTRDLCGEIAFATTVDLDLQHGLIPPLDVVEAFTGVLDLGAHDAFHLFANSIVPEVVAIYLAVHDVWFWFGSAKGRAGAPQTARELSGAVRAAVLAWTASLPGVAAEERVPTIDAAIEELAKVDDPPVDAVTAVATAVIRLMTPGEWQSRLPRLERAGWRRVVATIAVDNTDLARQAAAAAMPTRFQREELLQQAIHDLTDDSSWDRAAALTRALEFDAKDAAAALVLIASERARGDAAVAALTRAGADLRVRIRDEAVPPRVRAAIARALPNLNAYEIEDLVSSLVAAGETDDALALVSHVDEETSRFAYEHLAFALYRHGGIAALAFVNSLSDEDAEHIVGTVAGELVERDAAAALDVLRSFAQHRPLTWKSATLLESIAARGLLCPVIDLTHALADDFEHDWVLAGVLASAAAPDVVDLVFDMVQLIRTRERRADALARIVVRLLETAGPRFAYSMWEAWGEREPEAAVATTVAEAFWAAGEREIAAELLQHLLRVVDAVEDTWSRNNALVDITRFFLDTGDRALAERAADFITPSTTWRGWANLALARDQVRAGNRDAAVTRAWSIVTDTPKRHAHVVAEAVALLVAIEGRSAVERFIDLVRRSADVRGRVKPLLAVADALRVPVGSYIPQFGNARPPAARAQRATRWLPDRIELFLRNRHRRVVLRAALEEAERDPSHVRSHALAAVARGAATVDRRLSRHALVEAEKSLSDGSLPAGEVVALRAGTALAHQLLGNETVAAAQTALVRGSVHLLPARPPAFELTGSLAARLNDAELARGLIDAGLAMAARRPVMDVLGSACRPMRASVSVAVAAAEHLLARLDETIDEHTRQAVIANATSCAIATEHAALLGRALTAAEGLHPPHAAETLLGGIRAMIDGQRRADVVEPWLAAAGRALESSRGAPLTETWLAELTALRHRIARVSGSSAEALWTVFRSERLQREEFFGALHHAMPLLYDLDSGRTLDDVAKSVLNIELWWPHTPGQYP